MSFFGGLAKNRGFGNVELDGIDAQLPETPFLQRNPTTMAGRVPGLTPTAPPAATTQSVRGPVENPGFQAVPPGGGGGGGGGAPGTSGHTAALNNLFAGGIGPGGGGGAPPESAFLGFFENQLRNLFNGGFGISQDVQEQQRAMLNAMANRNLDSGLKQLTSQLNASGALGGGREIALARDLTNNIQESLLNQLAQQNLGFNQAFLQDRQAAFGAGNQFSGSRIQQQLGLGDINARNRATGVTRELGLGDLALRRELGLGQLDLGRGQLGVAQGQLGLGNRQEDRLLSGQQFSQGLQTFLTNAGLLGLA